MKPLVQLALAVLWLFPGAAAALEYRGEETLFRDTVWEGEVLVDGILTVAPEVKLEIRPGTEVRFTYRDSNGDGIGESEIFVQGVLDVRGTAEKPILFTAAGPIRRPGAWGAINVMASERDNLLEHCIVEYGYRGFHAHFGRGTLRHATFRHNQRGVQFQESEMALNDCLIESNGNGLQFRDSRVQISGTGILGNYWGLRCVYSDVEMRDCRIEGNLVNGANLRDTTFRATGNRIAGNRRGLYLQRSLGLVQGNQVLDNSEHGIFLEQGDVLVTGNRIAGNGRAGVRWLDATGLLEGNDLAGNGEYALINDGTGAVDAPRNWWGSVRPEVVAAQIRDGLDRPGLGLVAAEALHESPWRQD